MIVDPSNDIVLLCKSSKRYQIPVLSNICHLWVITCPRVLADTVALQLRNFQCSILRYTGCHNQYDLIRRITEISLMDEHQDSAVLFAVRANQVVRKACLGFYNSSKKRLSKFH